MCGMAWHVVAGGYMSALALGAAKMRHGIDLQAVVTGGTLSDLISHTGTTDISKIINSWAGGYHWDSPKLRAMMMQNSGIYHIENATAPTLMFHGIDDPRMPITQVRAPTCTLLVAAMWCACGAHVLCTYTRV